MLASVDAHTGKRAMTVKHLNQTELAGRWNISARTLERWRRNGEGPRFLKLGRRVVYRLEDIEAFEARQLHGDDRRGRSCDYRITKRTRRPGKAFDILLCQRSPVLQVR